MASPAQPKSLLRPIAGLLLGFAVVAVLHVVVSLLVAIVGSMVKTGAELVFVFWVFLGLAQWVYLIPAALVARGIGFSSVAKGIWIAGALLTLLTAFCWGAALLPRAIELITGNSPPNTVTSDNYGRVTNADASQLSVQIEGAQSPTTYRLRPDTKFGFLGPAWQDQPSPASPKWLTPGRRVSVEYVTRQRVNEANRVTIWVEKPEPEPAP